MLYKQHVIDEYYEDKAKPVRAAVGFYWAMHSRDTIQEIADSFLNSLPTIQEIDPDTGKFLNIAEDETELCMQDFMDFIDVAMYNAISENTSNKDKWKDSLNVTEIQEKTWHLLANNYKGYENMSDVAKYFYLKDVLWNYDDFKESFQYGIKRFTNSLIEKYMLTEVDEVTGEPLEGFNCTIKDLYGSINELKEINRGMPTKREDVEPHSDEEMDLITRAMMSEDYIGEIIKFILE